MVQQLRKIAWISAFACLVIGFGFSVWSAEREPDRSAQRNTQTRTTEKSLLLAQASQTEKPDNIAPDNSAKSAEEASEYWTIFGRRLRLTDTLLAALRSC